MTAETGFVVLMGGIFILILGVVYAMSAIVNFAKILRLLKSR